MSINLKKIISFTSGKNTPSANYRIRQYIPYLKNNDIYVDDYFPRIDKNIPPPFFIENIKKRYIYPYAILWDLYKLSYRVSPLLKHKKYDVAWLNREFLPGHYSLERFLKIPYVFDFDDAIWMTSAFGLKSFEKLCANASVVTAGNEFLAYQARQFSDNVIVVPTAVDTNKIYPIPKNKSDKFIVGWVGTSGNFKYLYDIEDELFEFISSTNSSMLIISDVLPKFNKMNLGHHFQFRKWKLDDENEFLNSIDVGIMPLKNSEWERGKCSFKMLQYMCAAKPVIVSPVGMNNEILSMGTFGYAASVGYWSEYLHKLYDDQHLCKSLGDNGLRIIKSNYATNLVANKIKKIMDNIC